MTSSGLLTRLVLGFLLALPFVAPWLPGSIGGEQGYTFVLRMSSTTGGVLQLFYDIGYGYSEYFQVTAPQVVTDTGFEYRLPLPSARYWRLRIDPAAGGGRYTIERASIARVADGSTAVSIPLMELQPLQQLTVLERTPERLVLSAPSDSNDPLLEWAPSSPQTMMLAPRQLFRVLAGIAIFWIGGALAAWAVVGLLRKVWPTRSRLVDWTAAFGASNPTAAIIIIAFVATVVATYPVLFAGRSFVSPANYGTPLLYDQPPFSPGSDEFVVEDTRGSDVGAMMWQSLPHSQIERLALAMGEVPLWNRYTAIGRPLWGQGLSYILDPLQWLTFFGTDPAPGWDLKFVAHRFLFATGVGLASLAATSSWLPAVIVAAAAPFVGAFSYRFNHPAIFSLTYAPWALLGWFLLAQATSASARARAAILLAVGTALLLVAPTPKEGAIAVLGVSATGALAVVLSVGSWQLRRQRLGAAMVASVAAILLTAPHWLVFLDTVSLSTHAYETPSVHVGGLAHRVGLWVNTVIPGTPQPGLHLFALMLVVVAVSAPLRLWNDRAAVASLVVAALILAVALGVVPASGLIAVPLISQISHLYDVLMLATVPLLLIVSATGARILCSAGAARTLVATLATGLAVVWLFARFTELGPLDRFEPWALVLLLPLAVVWPACVLAARRQSAGAVIAASATMAALLLPGGLHVDTGIAAIDRLLFQPRSRPRLSQPSPAIDAIHAATTTTPTRTTGITGILNAGSSALYRLEDLRGADPLEVRAYRELLDASGMQRPMWWLTSFSSLDVPRLGPMLDMLNVGYLVAPFDALPPGVVLEMNGPDLVRAIRRPTPWPRAFFADGTTTYATPADLVQQVSARGAPFAAILDGDARAADATNGLPRTSGHTVAADNYTLTANTTTFRVHADREGIAVLGETYLPDEFIASLNGNAVPYFCVNHVFKAVRIPGPGEWTVRFEYRPRRWGLALGAAGLGALILVALGAVAWRSPAPVAQTSPTERVYA